MTWPLANASLPCTSVMAKRWLCISMSTCWLIVKRGISFYDDCWSDARLVAWWWRKVFGQRHIGWLIEEVAAITADGWRSKTRLSTRDMLWHRSRRGITLLCITGCGCIQLPLLCWGDILLYAVLRVYISLAAKLVLVFTVTLSKNKNKLMSSGEQRAEEIVFYNLT